MNQKTTYEITIAEKLGQLQAPGMREAIWSRIEAQLDLDLPEGDDNPGPDQPTGPDWMSFSNRFGLFAVVVAVAFVTIFYTNQKQDKTHTPTQPLPASTKQVLPQNPGDAPPGVPGVQDQATAPSRDNGANQSPGPVTDSFMNVPLAMPQGTADSTPPLVQPNPPPVTQTVIPPFKTDTVPKKSRGFKGISDNDYRISLKKDSVP